MSGVCDSRVRFAAAQLATAARLIREAKKIASEAAEIVKEEEIWRQSLPAHLAERLSHFRNEVNVYEIDLNRTINDTPDCGLMMNFGEFEALMGREVAAG